MNAHRLSRSFARISLWVEMISLKKHNGLHSTLFSSVPS
uniref:Uncharacterized protein n=1 Tax=Arundo donax TaxID=35708 RepID=A0A0A9FXU2_ARUDO